MYKVAVVPKKGSRPNPIHEIVNNRMAKIDFMEKGKRGYFEILTADAWRSISTSAVIEVVEEDENVKVETLYTNYYFEKVKGEN